MRLECDVIWEPSRKRKESRHSSSHWRRAYQHCTALEGQTRHRCPRSDRPFHVTAMGSEEGGGKTSSRTMPLLLHVGALS